MRRLTASAVVLLLALLPALSGVTRSPHPVLAQSAGPTAAPAAASPIVDAGPYSNRGLAAVAMNALGHITAETSGNQASFFDGTVHALGVPKGAAWSSGAGINDADQIVANAGGGAAAGSITYAVHVSGRTVQWDRLPLLPGYVISRAGGITPNARAVVGTLCKRGSRSCRAVIWRWNGSAYLRPKLLPVGASTSNAGAAAVVKLGGTTVTVGHLNAGKSCAFACAELWFGLSKRLSLTGTAQLPNGTATSIAHGAGGTLYVGGELIYPTTGVTVPAEWTVRCTSSRCRQIGSVRVYSTMGFVSAVNGKGWAVGYQRPGGGGGGDAMLWADGKAVQLDLTLTNAPQWLGMTYAAAINDAGQIVGPGQTVDEHSHLMLLPPPTDVSASPSAR